MIKFGPSKLKCTCTPSLLVESIYRQFYKFPLNHALIIYIYMYILHIFQDCFTHFLETSKAFYKYVLLVYTFSRAAKITSYLQVNVIFFRIMTQLLVLFLKNMLFFLDKICWKNGDSRLSGKYFLRTNFFSWSINSCMTALIGGNVCLANACLNLPLSL